MNPTLLSNEYSYVPSPCVGVCVMDQANRWCVGCLRSRGEIGGWSSMTDREKFVLWAQLTQRCKEPQAPRSMPAPEA